MAPPKGKGGRGDDLKQEEILQAVVIADSFNVRFGPITDKRPRALLPLVNLPMLDYVLHFLEMQGIQETFVFCCHHADQIRAHLANSKWQEGGVSSMTVKTVLAEGCRSVGDALREMDVRSLTRSDFFLLSSDTIANVNLKNLMKEHKARREVTKSAVMTVNCMRIPANSKHRCYEDNIVVAVEPKRQQILYYESVPLDRRIRIPQDGGQNVRVHADLVDSQLYVCSASVLHLFTDNFDYCTVEDFVHGILINEEILGNTIHMNVLKNEYCLRVTNPYMYDIISRDIILHRTHPITPLSRFGKDPDVVNCSRPKVHLSSQNKIGRTVSLVHNLVVGKGTQILDDSEIANSVVGRNCKIGRGVKLSGCYVWDDVTIEDGCTVTDSIICSGVTLFANTVVQPHSILSYNVKVGPDVTLDADIRLKDAPTVDPFADPADVKIPEVTPQYGSKSKAFLFTPGLDEDDEDAQDEVDTHWGEVLLNGKEDDTDDIDGAPLQQQPAVVASATADDDLQPEDEEEEDEYEQFYAEVMATLKRAAAEKISCENVILEVNSLKHAYNISISEVYQAAVRVLVEIPYLENADAPEKQLKTATLKHVATYKGLVDNYIKKEREQMDLLHTLEEFVVEHEKAMCVLSPVVQFLYKGDTLEEEVVIQWYEDELDDEDDEEEQEQHKRVRKEMKAFVTWLKEADEESEESDE